MRRSNAPAISETTNRPRRRRDPGFSEPLRVPSRSVSWISALEAKSASAMEKSKVVSREAPAQKNKTPELTAMGLKRGRSLGISDSRTLMPQAASNKPPIPPRMAIGKPSMRSCVRRRPRPAPIAERTANSCWRAVARVSIRLAIFAQAISRTNATAPNRISRAERTSPTNCSRTGTTFAPIPLFSGNCCSSWLAMPDNSVAVAFRFVAGFRRAITLR